MIIGIWIMCWLSLRNAGHLTVSPFLCLSKVEILGFDFAFLLGFSLVLPISSVTLHRARTERRSCRPVKPCDRLTYFRQHKPQPNISILILGYQYQPWCVTGPSGTSPTAMACWSICVCPAIAQDCGFSPKSDLCLLPAGLTFCSTSPQPPARTAALRLAALQPQALREGSASMSWSHQG